MVTGQRKVSVMAMNLMVGDVVEGERISNIIRFKKRSRKKGLVRPKDLVGLMVITPCPKGYDIKTRKFTGSDRVTIHRPKCNR